MSIPNPAKNPFPLSQAGQLAVAPPEQRWLVDALWGHLAVGLIAGDPKTAKTWWGLHLALSVASGVPLFGRFAVHHSGPALVYIAEDQLPVVRARLDDLCEHHQLDIDRLDLYVITAPVMRLDLPRDQQRLIDTLEQVRPALLLLDPLVRIHALEENHASDIARLLGFFRELQRSFQTSVAIVHHTNKKKSSRAGRSLRGSSDIWAWTDSAAYLARKDDDSNQIAVTLEHRAAPPPDPLSLALVSRTAGSATHLQLLSDPRPAQPSLPLQERLLAFLRQTDAPLRRTALRQHLRVNNQRLGHALDQLERAGQIVRTSGGWCARSENRSGDPQPSLLA